LFSPLLVIIKLVKKAADTINVADKTIHAPSAPANICHKINEGIEKIAPPGVTTEKPVRKYSAKPILLSSSRVNAKCKIVRNDTNITDEQIVYRLLIAYLCENFIETPTTHANSRIANA